MTTTSSSGKLFDAVYSSFCHTETLSYVVTRTPCQWGERWCEFNDPLAILSGMANVPLSGAVKSAIVRFCLPGGIEKIRGVGTLPLSLPHITSKHDHQYEKNSYSLLLSMSHQSGCREHQYLQRKNLRRRLWHFEPSPTCTSIPFAF